MSMNSHGATPRGRDEERSDERADWAGGDEPTVPRRPSIGVDSNDPDAQYDLPHTD